MYGRVAFGSMGRRVAHMERTTLGRTGIQVSRYCLGAMMFGAWGNRDHDDCIRIIHHALDAGINFIDTADVYSAGESEEIVGKALKGRRDEVVLATKFVAPMGEDTNQRGASRRWIMQEVENSLRRLDTDYIDLYQAHRPDPTVDLDETLGRAVRPRPPGQGARDRQLDVPGRARSSRRSGWPSSAAASGSAASSRRTRSSLAASRPRCCRPARSTAWA